MEREKSNSKKNTGVIPLIGFWLFFYTSLGWALEFRGEWRQGGLILGEAQPGTRITFQGKPVEVSPEGYFVLGLSRDESALVKLVAETDNHTHVREFSVASRQYRIQKIEGVPDKTVTPPPEVMERIRRESQLVAAARAVSDPRLDFLGGFVKPLEGPITGVYGSQRYYNGVAKNPHYGLDIAAPTGTVVSAPAPGVVRLAEPDLYFSGGTLIVDHGYGVFSSFIHLSELLVQVGETVKTGDAIARVGATGRATGPHLDWRINWFDVRVDPAIVLNSFPAEITSPTLDASE